MMLVLIIMLYMITFRYDDALQGYKEANILTQQSLAFLNSGQNVIISVGRLICTMNVMNNLT